MPSRRPLRPYSNVPNDSAEALVIVFVSRTSPDEVVAFMVAFGDWFAQSVVGAGLIARGRGRGRAHGPCRRGITSVSELQQVSLRLVDAVASPVSLSGSSRSTSSSSKCLMRASGGDQQQ